MYFEDGGSCGVTGFDFDGDIVKEFRAEPSEEQLVSEVAFSHSSKGGCGWSSNEARFVSFVGWPRSFDVGSEFFGSKPV